MHTRLCVPLTAATVDELLSVMNRAASVADVFEVRADYFAPRECEILLERLDSLLAHAPRQILLTLRAGEQGGVRRELSFVERTEFFRRALPAVNRHGALVDLELDLALHFQKDTETPLDWQRVICSHHDFACVPTDLIEIYEKLKATPARVLKIAVTAHDATDCLPVFDLYARARRDEKEFIALAMNEAGKPTRVLAPLYGAFLTYAALNDAGASAPGQLTAGEMREVYRVGAPQNQIDEKQNRLDEKSFGKEKPFVCGIIGNPVAHSLSPQMHNRAFAAHGINAVYVPFQVADAPGFIKRFVHPQTRETAFEIKGLSVTAPHKQTVLPILDSVDEAARNTGAVNTIVVEDGKLCGYNTDALAALAPFDNVDLRDARVAVLGAGGAARSVLWSLKQRAARVSVFARHQLRGASLAREYAVDFAALANADFNGFDIVINTTPLGTRGALEHETPVRSEHLHNVKIAYDLVYNPSETLFLREAASVGCKTHNGLAMLITQAAHQFQLWTNIKQRHVTKIMRAALENRL